jgi:hypothetical protein
VDAVAVDVTLVDVPPVGVDAAKVVVASHVFATPLVEIIVKFPPVIPFPCLARFGYKKNQQRVGYCAITSERSTPIPAHWYVPLSRTRWEKRIVNQFFFKGNVWK